MNKKSILKDSDVRWDEREGRPRKVRGEFALPSADTMEESIKAFLRANADELSFRVSDEDLRVIQDVSTPVRRIVRFQQLQDGIPVFGAIVMVQLDKNNRVRQLDLGHVSRVRIAAPAADEKMTGDKAMEAAKDSLGDFNLREKVSKPKEIYYPTPDGLKLAYMVMILTEEPIRDWRIFVDGYTGEILDKEDRLLDINGEGKVFDPNPVVTANDSTLRDPNATVATCGYAGTDLATIDAECVTRPLRDITFSDGKHKLEGPYVKLIDLGSPNIAPPEETNKDDFKYSSAHDGFEAVMAYYHIDTIQRYIQSLGIPNAHNSQIDVDHHYGSGGASYSPSQDAIRLGASGGTGPCGYLPEECRPDRGQDGDVMLHEYGHGIQHDQVPGWGGTNPTTLRNETGAMGEGFGDILACVYFGPNHPYQREVFEDWIFVNCGGLRRVDGTKVYPWNIPSGPGGDWVNNVHDDGEIWSAALWNIYRVIGGDSTSLGEREAARHELLKTVILSHLLNATNGTMPEGAEAVMDTNADLDDYRGKHLIEMLDSFHDRGILHCAVGSDLKLTKLWGQQDDLTTHSHENFEFGQDNWFYAEVRNDGTTEARAFVVTFSYKSPFSTPVYPSSFRDNIISAAVEFNLAPGATRTVHSRFPKELIPAIPAGSERRHGCIFAEVYNPVDHVPAGATTIGASNGKLKYRNTDIVDLLPNDTVDYFFEISNFRLAKKELVRLEVIRPQKWENVEIGLHHQNPGFIKELWRAMEVIEATAVKPIEEAVRPGTEVRMLQPTKVAVGRMGERQLIFNLARDSSVMVPDRSTGEVDVSAKIDEDFLRRDADLITLKDKAYLRLRPGHRVGLPYVMKPRDRTTLNVKIKAPKDAKPGDQFTIEAIQRNTKGELRGGFDIQVNIVKR